MIDPNQMPPTRTSLIQLQGLLAEARQGYDLLERKREVLLRELWGMYREAEDIEGNVRSRFAQAYGAQQKARLRMGSEKLHWAGLAPACRTAYATRVRNVMGVPLPHVTMEVVPLRLPHSPAGISMAFEEVIQRWTEVGQILGSWIQALGGISRVITELEKTQRRVNALKHILIPQYRTVIERIRSVLEEQERDSFIRAKRVKLSRGDQMGRLL